VPAAWAHPAASIWPRPGVGTITLVDDDTSISPTCSARSCIPRHASAWPRRIRASRRCTAINPEIQIVPLQQRLSGEALDALVGAADVVLDCCDNFATRHAINRACVHHRKPLVPVRPSVSTARSACSTCAATTLACYHCLFPEGEDVEEVRCAVMGVFAPLTGIIGTMQAAEALKLIAGIGEVADRAPAAARRLAMEWRSVRFGRTPAAPSAGEPERLKRGAGDQANIAPTWRRSRICRRRCRPA
jgi:molybdopterin/thiamine biosynthesis adenylyltransferase